MKINLKAQAYREQIQMIEKQLNKENKAYMSKVNIYLVLASIFHDAEETVAAQLLTIYQDVLQAQQDGMTAQEFLGQDTKAMADKLITQLPKLSFGQGLKWLFSILFYFWGMFAMMSFAAIGYLVVEPVFLLVQGLAVLGPLFGVYLLLKNLVYQTSRLKAMGTCLLALFLYLFFLFGAIRLTDMGPSFDLPTGLSALVIFLFLDYSWSRRAEPMISHIYVPISCLSLLSGLIMTYVPLTASLKLHLGVGAAILLPLVFILGTIVLLIRKPKNQ